MDCLKMSHKLGIGMPTFPVASLPIEIQSSLLSKRNMFSVFSSPRECYAAEGSNVDSKAQAGSVCLHHSHAHCCLPSMLTTPGAGKQ